jgi:hypothetical protein
MTACVAGVSSGTVFGTNVVRSGPVHGRVWLGSALLLTVPSGCRVPNQDQQWEVGETREVFATPRDLPKSRSSRSDFSVVLPLGLPRSAVALAAVDSLLVGPGAEIARADTAIHAGGLGIASTMGRGVIRQGAEVGSIYDYGDVPLLIDPGALVHGYIKSVTGVSGPRWVRSADNVLDHVDSHIEAFRWRLDPPSTNQGNRASHADDKRPIDLQPGAYAAVSVGPNSTMFIHPGHYYFNSLEVQDRGTLKIDNLCAPIYVWVRDSLDLSGSMLASSLIPNVLIGYAGRSPPTIKTEFWGTLVAPAATLTLPATTKPHTGSFFARSIVVEGGASVEARGFVGGKRSAPDAAFVCTGCALSTKRMALECCDQLNRSISTARRAENECVASCTIRPGNRATFCRMQCAAWRAEKRIDARAWLGECLDDTSSAYVRCLQLNAYRPDTCLEMGFPGHQGSSCSDT